VSLALAKSGIGPLALQVCDRCRRTRRSTCHSEEQQLLSALWTATRASLVPQHDFRTSSLRAAARSF